MSTIVTRTGKGSPLTTAEMDNNFTNLNTDKYQSGDAATFSSVSIDAPTTDIVINNNTGITSWVYSGKTVSVATEESAATGIFIGSSGTKMYVTGTTGDDVNEYTLSTAWDVSTATFTAVSTGVTQDTAPADLFFSPDGLTLFVLGGTNDTVYQYTLSVAWNITTATYSTKSFSVTTQEATPSGMWFKSDGTVMYIVGTTNDTVYQYNLGTAWDISTASYASISFSVVNQESNPSQVVLSNDGTKMWVMGTTGDDINEYTLGTAWNVSTATFVNNFYIGFQDATPGGLFIDSTAANRVYMVGSATDAIYQYNTVDNAIGIATDKLYVTGEGYVDGNFVAGNNAYVDGTLVVQGSGTFGSLTAGTTSVSGTLTATSTLTLGGSTTGTAAFATTQTTANTTICTAQTTGTLTIGGTAQTGAITMGQSTGAQTLNLATGATTNGTTKAVNIGTAGVSGSTTNIAIGSAVSGALGTTTLNSNVVYTKLMATSAAAPTVASAATIAPTTPIVFVSGTTQINTITAPAPISSGGGQITIIPTGLWSTGTSGNIALATTAVVSRALIMTYDATTTKWYPSY